jgi:cyclic-di-AMP phosphodiesterase PgpH
VKYHVREDERIVAAHDPITAEVMEKLTELRRLQVVVFGEGAGTNLRGISGQLLMDLLVLSVFWLLLMLYLPEIYDNLRSVLVFATLFGVVVVGAFLNHRFIHPGSELIPIPFAAMVITVLFNGRIAIVAAMILAVLLGSQAVYGWADAFLISLIGGVTAALSVRRVTRRSHILISAAFVMVAFAIASLTVGLRAGWSIADYLSTVSRGAANAFISASLAFLVLPIFEGMARITTDLTLLELSDPARPLLRRLATEVPGTYAHSVAVANLCEAGCNEIGANGLLARVGCYYHDIGKMHRPAHFSENQGPGGNPHDRLPPETSADIIRGHVTQGMKLAEEARLPKVVRDFIPEHHGTRQITYFLDKARKSGEVPQVESDRFQYPGPKPQSVETAVAMIADGVEAVIRVLDEPSPQRVRDAINHVIKQRLDEGQFNEAPLTLGQLERVREAFERTLEGMRHSRIDYPEEAGGISANWSAASGA